MKNALISLATLVLMFGMAPLHADEVGGGKPPAGGDGSGESTTTQSITTTDVESCDLISSLLGFCERDEF